MTSFTAMTWNVQNLFIPAADGDGVATTAQFDAKLSALASVIDQATPDVLALQEVGPPEALDALQAALGHAMPHRIIASPDRRGIRVALLSTTTLANGQEIRPFPELIRPIQAKDPVFDDTATEIDESLLAGMARPGLRAELVVDGTTVTVITAHFKSKLISYARQRGLVGGSTFSPNDEGERNRYKAYALYRRTTDAITVRNDLNTVLQDPDDPDGEGLGKTAPVVMMGDLNDEPSAATTQMIAGPSGSELPVDAEGDVPDPIPGNSGFAKPDKHDGYRMWNLTPLIPLEKQVTRVHKGRGEVLDHIFASRSLISPENLPTVTTLTPAALPSIGDNPGDHRDHPGSDHAAVIATLDIVTQN